jgi:hypothetical protein
MCTLSWWISVDTVAVGLSFESLYSGPTHLLGARPRFLRSSLERLAIAVGCSWWLFRDTAGAWWSLGKWCVLGRCKIGRSYTINEWICGMQRGGSVRGTDKSKDLSLSGGCLTRRRIHARDRTVLDFARGIATVGPGIGTNLVQSASSSGGGNYIATLVSRMSVPWTEISVASILLRPYCKYRSISDSTTDLYHLLSGDYGCIFI